MYPNLFYLCKDLFGIELPFLKAVNSFGFFVALSFLAAAFFLVKELKRKQAQGLLTYTETIVTVGKPASFSELLTHFLIGFILGYKILGIFFVANALNDPQNFIFSSEGSWPAGILLGLLLAGIKWQEKHKKKLNKPEQRVIRIWPSDRVGDMVIIAAIAGFIGAKIFDNLENWNRFIEDPIGNLFSPSGLTFYGGLIVATIVLAYYFRKNKIPFIHMVDATAPSLMLAYGVGRIGCQVAGDGDWGIINSAYVSNSTGKVFPVTSHEQFISSFHFYESYYSQQENIRFLPTKAFWGLPDWLFAYTYPHNVNKEGVPLANCTWGDYCNYLPLPVYPTPLYEIIMCLLLFALLWALRKKIAVPGRLFAVYLFANGIERFLIEKIRVNTRYSIFGFHPTQAELISAMLVIAGILLYVFAPSIKWKTYTIPKSPQQKAKG